MATAAQSLFPDMNLVWSERQNKDKGKTKIKAEMLFLEEARTQR